MKKILISILSLAAIITSIIIYKLPYKYAVSKIPTPIYNTEEITKTFDISSKDNTLKAYNKRKLITELETIAFPNTIFEIKKTIKKGDKEILKIETEEYPYKTNTGYYIDSRYVKKHKFKPNKKERKLPQKEDILKYLNKIKEENTKEKIQYIWGGNIHKGIPEIILYYPQIMIAKRMNQKALSKNDFNQYILKGIDCSGLLYEATKGYSPRNTSKLKTFGEGIDIENKTLEEIISSIKPLDIIVLPTHVIIILNDKETIESVYEKSGVHTEAIKERLSRIMKEYKATNEARDKKTKDWFVIRRWIK